MRIAGIGQALVDASSDPSGIERGRVMRSEADSDLMVNAAKLLRGGDWIGAGIIVGAALPISTFISLEFHWGNWGRGVGVEPLIGLIGLLLTVASACGPLGLFTGAAITRADGVLPDCIPRWAVALAVGGCMGARLLGLVWQPIAGFVMGSIPGLSMLVWVSRSSPSPQ